MDQVFKRDLFALGSGLRAPVYIDLPLFEFCPLLFSGLMDRRSKLFGIGERKG
jgi:orotate phosphoribosyltransferase